MKNRWYGAVKEGVPERRTDVIDTLLEEENRKKRYCKEEQYGKRAITKYRILKSNATNALLDLELETGRKNQIRAHMEYIGYPVVGDLKYGAQTDPDGRLMLHAYRLFFLHPATGREMRFETPVPFRFKELVK